MSAQLVRFYDMQIEAMRDVTQDDWDLLFQRVEEKHRQICAVRELIAHLEAAIGPAKDDAS